MLLLSVSTITLIPIKRWMGSHSGGVYSIRTNIINRECVCSLIFYGYCNFSKPFKQNSINWCRPIGKIIRFSNIIVGYNYYLFRVVKASLIVKLACKIVIFQESIGANHFTCTTMQISGKSKKMLVFQYLVVLPEQFILRELVYMVGPAASNEWRTNQI